MTNRRQNQVFSVIEAIVVVLILALLGCAGWFAWHKRTVEVKDSGQHGAPS